MNGPSGNNTITAEAARIASGLPLSRRPRFLEFSLTLLAGAAILVGTFFFVDIGEVGEDLRRICYSAAMLGSWLWRRSSFARCAGRLSLAILADRFTSATHYYLEATFINAFLPTLIASDGVRIFRAIGSGASAMDALIGVVTDRIVALAALAIAAATGVIFLPGAIHNPWLLAAIVVILPALFLRLIARLDENSQEDWVDSMRSRTAQAGHRQFAPS